MAARPPRSTAKPIGARSNAAEHGIVIGTLHVGEADEILVDFPGNPAGRAIPAASTVALPASADGARVALAFESGDHTSPIVLGRIRDTVEHAPAATTGKTLDLEAEEALTLRCGKASITLTKDGKVLVRGTHLLSRATGVNKIKGGSIQLN